MVKVPLHSTGAESRRSALFIGRGRDGTTVVIRSGAEFDVLTANTLDDGFDTSPALVDNDIYLRGYQYLYAISEQ